MKVIKFFYTVMYVLLLINTTAWAETKTLQCFVTVNKDPVWYQFDVNIVMYGTENSESKKSILTFNLARASQKTPSTNTDTQQFDCQVYQQFQFTATFLPAIWHDTQGNPINNIFDSVKIYDISAQVLNPPTDVDKLTITVNFPKDFNVNQDPSLLIQKNQAQ